MSDFQNSKDSRSLGPVVTWIGRIFVSEASQNREEWERYNINHHIEHNLCFFFIVHCLWKESKLTMSGFADRRRLLVAEKAFHFSASSRRHSIVISLFNSLNWILQNQWPVDSQLRVWTIWSWQYALYRKQLLSIQLI